MSLQLLPSGWSFAQYLFLYCLLILHAAPFYSFGFSLFEGLWHPQHQQCSEKMAWWLFGSEVFLTYVLEVLHVLIAIGLFDLLFFPPGLVTAWSLLPFYPWPGAKQAGDRRRSVSRRSSYCHNHHHHRGQHHHDHHDQGDQSQGGLSNCHIHQYHHHYHRCQHHHDHYYLGRDWMSRRQKKSVPRRSYVHRPNIDDCFDRNFDCWLISWL